MKARTKPLARPGGSCAVCGIEIDRRSTYCRMHRPKPDYEKRTIRAVEAKQAKAELAAERQRIAEVAIRNKALADAAQSINSLPVKSFDGTVLDGIKSSVRAIALIEAEQAVRALLSQDSACAS